MRRALREREVVGDFFEAFRAGMIGWTGTMVIRREALVEAGLFRVGEQRYEDTDMWLRIAYRHREIGYLRRPLAVHHLDVPGSLTRTYEHIHLFYDHIERHAALSREHGCGVEFAACARFMLHRTMRSMLFRGQGRDIREILRRFGPLVAWRYRVAMWTLTIFPRATALGCHLISRILRAVGLGKKLIRRPLKAKLE